MEKISKEVTKMAGNVPMWSFIKLNNIVRLNVVKFTFNNRVVNE